MTTIPRDEDFLERGFSVGANHDPDRATFGYSREYDDGSVLLLAFGPTCGDFFAELQRDGRPLASVATSGVTSVAFQGWHSARIVRITSSTRADVRIVYSPRPRLETVVADA